jgi:hypothetical protein
VSSETFTYRFIPVRLKDLDGEQGGLLVASLFDEDRPPAGLTGLVDWRMDGLISRIRVTTVRPELDNPHFQGMALGPFAANEGEKLLFPAGRHLPFDMVLVLGLGKRAAFGGQGYRNAVATVLQTAASMKVKRLTLQLPGWNVAGLPARRACDIFVTEMLTQARRDKGTPLDLCIVEELEHQAEMDERIVEILNAQGRR